MTGFDKLRLRHTILYDDGDREIIALWSPTQLVRVLNQPNEWAAAVEEIERREEEEKRKKAPKKAKGNLLSLLTYPGMAGIRTCRDGAIDRVRNATSARD